MTSCHRGPAVAVSSYGDEMGLMRANLNRSEANRTVAGWEAKSMRIAIAIGLLLLTGCRQAETTKHLSREQPLGPWRLVLLEARIDAPVLGPSGPEGMYWLRLTVGLTPPENGSLAASDIAVLDGANGRHGLYAIAPATEDEPWVVVGEGRNPIGGINLGWASVLDKNRKRVPNLLVLPDRKGEVVLALTFDYAKMTSVFTFQRRNPERFLFSFAVPLGTKGLRLQLGDKDFADVPGYIVRGRVVDEIGRSVGGVALRVDGELVSSGGDGQFFVLRKQAATCNLEVLPRAGLQVESAPAKVVAAPGELAKDVTVVVSWPRR